jgi:hypothetical protein
MPLVKPEMGDIRPLRRAQWVPPICPTAFVLGSDRLEQEGIKKAEEIVHRKCLYEVRMIHFPVLEEIRYCQRRLKENCCIVFAEPSGC